ncbi:unnamed protein product [Periconia digitata]|uniref:Uncharacterized protein n=1 Tax=Periconia digitata TaxID=1303443 RepID=A0A9W4U4F8_9PLEO|nr:unnamed protein product [Periconia digitata]
METYKSYQSSIIRSQFTTPSFPPPTFSINSFWSTKFCLNSDNQRHLLIILPLTRTCAFTAISNLRISNRARNLWDLLKWWPLHASKSRLLFETPAYTTVFFMTALVVTPTLAIAGYRLRVDTQALPIFKVKAQV